MGNLNELLNLSVEKAVKKLLDHFKDQYGNLIFIPLGINNSTPKKIAPNIAESVETKLLNQKEGEIEFLFVDEKIGEVFDDFMNSFFNSLNFIAKGVMKALGMKMFWNDFSQQLATNKKEKPETYEMWKKNFNIVLESMFDEIYNDLIQSGTTVILTNGEKTFSSVQEGIAELRIFQ